MTSSYGTFSAYESIAPYRLYLDLSLDDKEFNSGIINPLYYTENTNNNKIINNINDNTTYNIMSNNENLSEFKKFIDIYKFKNFLTGDFTLFIPINNFINDLFNTIKSTQIEPLNILKYHMIEYIITPMQMFNKKLKFQTKLRNNFFMVDGDNNNLKIRKRDTGDMNNIKYINNKILQSIKTDNGYIYIIEKPLIPYIY